MIKLKRRLRVLTDDGVKTYKNGEKLSLPVKVEKELISKGAAEKTEKANDTVIKVNLSDPESQSEESEEKKEDK